MTIVTVPNCIAFEGGEGCGKSTVLERLANEPEFEGSLFTREPGGSPIGEEIRRVLKNPDLEREQWTNVFLFMASRSELVKRTILPALDSGRKVFLDRYYLSTLVYQWMVGMGNQDPSWFIELTQQAKMPAPGLVLWYDLDPVIGLSRRAASGSGRDYFDQQELDVHQRIRDAFTQLFTSHEPWRTVVRRIDASLSPDAVYAATLEHLRTHFHPSV